MAHKAGEKITKVGEKVWYALLITVLGVTLACGIWILGLPRIYDRSYDEDLRDAKTEEIASSMLVYQISACSVVNEKINTKICDEARERLEQYFRQKELDSQRTVAKATRGMLWIAAGQGATSLATLGLLAFAVYQTSRLLRDSGDATAAARTSADAAVEGQRAHVFVELEAIYGRPITDGKYKVKARIINYGQTPATAVKYEISPVILVGGQWRIFRHGDDCARPSAKGILEAIGLKDDTRLISLKHELGDDELNLLFRGAVSSELFHVQWDYVDIFGVPHGPYEFVAGSDALFRSTHKDWDSCNPDFSLIEEIRFVQKNGLQVSDDYGPKQNRSTSEIAAHEPP